MPTLTRMRQALRQKYLSTLVLLALAFTCIRYRLPVWKMISAALNAVNRHSIPFHLPHFLLMPISDVRSLHNNGVYGTSSSILVSIRSLVGIPAIAVKDWGDIIFVIGMSVLKRMGMLDEVVSVCRHIVKSKASPRRRALAYETLADLEHMFFVWADIAKREDHLAHFGIGSYYVRPGDTFFTIDHLNSDLFGTALMYYKCALEAAPPRIAAFYGIARLLFDAGDYEAAIQEYRKARIAGQELGFTKKQLPFLEHDSVLIEYMRHPQKGAERGTEEIARIFGTDAAFDLPLAEVAVVTILEDSELIATFGEQRCSKVSGEALNSEYNLYLDEGKVCRVSRQIVCDDIYVFKNVAMDVWPNYMPHIVLDRKYLPRANRIYSGPQFGLFDNSIAVHNNRTAVVIRQSLRRELSRAIICQGYADNYYHFLFDCIGSLAFFDSSELAGRTLVFVGGTSNFLPYQQEILELVGLHTVPAVKLSNFQLTVQTFDSFMVSNPNRLNVAHPKVIRFLRDRLLPGQSQQSISPTGRVFLYRATRRRVEGKEMTHFLDYMRLNGFTVVDPSSITVAEQRDLICNAQIVVLEIGAAAANMLFCPPGCHVVLLSCEFGYRDIFTPIATVLGIHLHVVFSANRSIYPKANLAWTEVWLSLSFNNAKLAISRILDEIGSGAKTGDNLAVSDCNAVSPGL